MQNAAGQPWRQKKQSCCSQKGGKQRPAQAAVDGASDAGGAAAAVLFCGKACHRDTRAGKAQREGKRKHGQHKLNEAQALRADIAGKICLKEHGQKPKQQRGRCQEECIFENQSSGEQKITFRSSLWSGRCGYEREII